MPRMHQPHCSLRQVWRTWTLLPAQGTHPDYRYQQLHVLTACAKCGNRVMRWVGVDEALDQVDKKIWTIKTKDQLNWLSRIKTHRYLPQAQLISDYTRLISRDPAVVSERVLERA